MKLNYPQENSSNLELHYLLWKNAVTDCTSVAEITSLLSSFDSEDAQFDLKDWISVLDKVNTFVNEHIIRGDKESTEFLRAWLKFSKSLLRNCQNKRYFLSLEHLGQLLRGNDTELTDLAAEVLFMYCTPSVSMAFYSSDKDWKDSCEVPSDIRDIAIAMFDGFGLFSPEYSLVDYLRGHEPLSCDESHVMHVQFQEKSSSESVSARNVVIPLNKIIELKDIIVDVDAKSVDVEAISKSKSLESVCLRSLVRAVNGLHLSAQDRVLNVINRLYAFYILLHSRDASDILQAYLKPGSFFVRDLLALSDVSSDIASDLCIDYPRQLAIVSLECLIGLIEASHRRNHYLSTFENSVLNDMNLLFRHRNSVEEDERNNTNSAAWISTFQTVCLEAETLLDRVSPYFKDDKRAAQGELAEESGIFIEEEVTVSDIENLSVHLVFELVCTFRYVRFLLEYFVSCFMSMQLSGTLITDSSPVSMIVGLAQLFAPAIEKLLPKPTVDTANYLIGYRVLNSVSFKQRIRRELMWTFGKVLLCFEMMISGPDVYQNAFKEANGLSIINLVFEKFSVLIPPTCDNSSSLLNSGSPFFDGIYQKFVLYEECVSHVFENALILLLHVVQNFDANFENNGDSGLRILNNPCFSQLCNTIFKLPYSKSTQFFWNQLIEIFCGAIDASPTFLSSLLSSDYFKLLVKRLSLRESPTTASLLNLDPSNPPQLLAKTNALTVLSMDSAPNSPERSGELKTVNEASPELSPMDAGEYGNLNNPIWFDNGETKVVVIRLINSCLLTTAGQNAFVGSSVLEHIIDSIVSTPMLFPHCNVGLNTSGSQIGTVHENISRIGKRLTNLIKDSNVHRKIVEKSLKKLVEDVCAEVLSLCKLTKDWSSGDDGKEVCDYLFDNNNTDMLSDRMQVMQKLDSVCSLLDSLAAESRRINTGGVFPMRNIVTPELFTKLLSCFWFTLPFPKQLIAQSCNPYNVHVSYHGYFPAANALSSVVKLAAVNGFSVLLGAIEDSLEYISLRKKSLFAPLAIFETETKVNTDMFSFADSPLGLPNQKKVSKVSGKSSNSGFCDVMLLGLLDKIPAGDSCGCETLLKTEDSRKIVQFWQLVSAIQELEWMVGILASCMKPANKPYLGRLFPSSSVSKKDTMRRLLAYHRSVLLELSDFCAENLLPMEISDGNIPDNFLDYRKSSKLSAPNTSPKWVYSLRVVSSLGALVREGVDIENSRIVFLGHFGAEFNAYERILSLNNASSGVIRYRTMYGWLSEYRRDRLREPLVELLDIREYNEHSDKFLADFTPYSYSYANSTEKTNGVKPDKSILTDLESEKNPLTIRESVAYMLSRSHTVLKSLEINLGKLIVGDMHNLSSSLSRQIRNLMCEYAPSIGKLIGKHCMKKMLVQHLIESPAEKILDGVSCADHNKVISTSNCSVKLESQCLYISTVVKYLLSPLVEDRSGGINIFLLKIFLDEEGLDVLLKCLVDSIEIFYAEFSADGSLSVENLRFEKKQLSTIARCSLSTVKAILLFLNKLVQRENLMKDPVSQYCTTEGNDITELFQLYKVFEVIYRKAAATLLDLSDRRNLICSLPLKLFNEFNSLCFSVVKNSRIPLPSPIKVSSGSATRSSAPPASNDFPTMRSYHRSPNTVRSALAQMAQAASQMRRVHVPAENSLGSISHTAASDGLDPQSVEESESSDESDNRDIPQSGSVSNESITTDQDRIMDLSRIFTFNLDNPPEPSFSSVAEPVSPSLSDRASPNAEDTGVFSSDHLDFSPILHSEVSSDAPVSTASLLQISPLLANPSSISVNESLTEIPNPDDGPFAPDSSIAEQVVMSGCSMSDVVSAMYSLRSNNAEEIIRYLRRNLRSESDQSRNVPLSNAFDLLRINADSPRRQLARAERRSNLPTAADLIRTAPRNSLTPVRAPLPNKSARSTPSAKTEEETVLELNGELKLLSDKLASSLLELLLFSCTVECVIQFVAWEMNTRIEPQDHLISATLRSLTASVYDALTKIRGEGITVKPQLLIDSRYDFEVKEEQFGYVNFNRMIFANTINILCAFRAAKLDVVSHRIHLFVQFQLLLHLLSDSKTGNLTNKSQLVSILDLCVEYIQISLKNVEEQSLVSPFILWFAPVVTLMHKLLTLKSPDSELEIESKSEDDSISELDNNINSYEKSVGKGFSSSNLFIIQSSRWSNVAEVILSIFKVIYNKQEMGLSLSGDICHAIFETIELITMDYENVCYPLVVNQNLISLLLSLKSDGNFNEARKITLFSNILLHLMENPFELKQVMSLHIKRILRKQPIVVLDKGPSGMSVHRMLLSDFIKAANFLILRDGVLFLKATRETLQFVKRMDSSGVLDNYVEFCISGEASSVSEICAGIEFSEVLNRSLCGNLITPILNSIVLQINKLVLNENNSEKQTNLLFSASDLLLVLANCVTDCYVLPSILISTDFPIPAIPNGGKGIFPFIFKNVLPLNFSRKENSNTIEALVRNSMLFLSRSAAQKSSASRFILDCIAKVLNEIASAHALYISDESEKMCLLGRLATICGIVIKSPKAGEVGSSQNLSLDSVCFMFSRGIPELFSLALSSIALDHKFSSNVIQNIIETLEVLSRPKLLIHVDKLLNSSKGNHCSNTEDTVKDISSGTEDAALQIVGDNVVDSIDGVFCNVESAGNNIWSEEQNGDRGNSSNNPGNIVRIGSENSGEDEDEEEDDDIEETASEVSEESELEDDDEASEDADEEEGDEDDNDGDEEDYDDHLDDNNNGIRASFLPDDENEIDFEEEGEGLPASSIVQMFSRALDGFAPSEYVTPPQQIRVGSGDPIHEVLFRYSEMGRNELQSGIVIDGLSSGSNDELAGNANYAREDELLTNLVRSLENDLLGGVHVVRSGIAANPRTANAQRRSDIIPNSFPGDADFQAMSLPGASFQHRLATSSNSLNILPTIPAVPREGGLLDSQPSYVRRTMVGDGFDVFTRPRQIRLEPIEVPPNESIISRQRCSLLNNILSSFANLEANVPAEVVPVANDSEGIADLENISTEILNLDLNSIVNSIPPLEVSVAAPPLTEGRESISELTSVESAIVPLTSGSASVDGIETRVQSDAACVGVQDNETINIVSENEVAEVTGNTEDVNVAQGSRTSSTGLICPAGYDFDVFDMLPVELQQEIIDQHVESSSNQSEVQQLVERAGYDYETFMALPEGIRQEILDQARRDQGEIGGENGGVVSEIDNASFLASLPDDLRREVLVSADEQFLASLPPNLLAEATAAREHAAMRWQQDEINEIHTAVSSRSGRHGENSQNVGHVTPSTVVSKPIPPGSMVIKCENNICSDILSVNLVPVIFKLICCTGQAVNYKLMFKLIFNLMKHGKIRDILLRLVVCVVTGDNELLTTLIGKMVSERAKFKGKKEMTDLWQRELNKAVQIMKDRRLNEKSSDKIASVTFRGQIEKSGKASPALVLRFLSTLHDLCSSNEAVVYDILKDREEIANSESLCEDRKSREESRSEHSVTLLELIVNTFSLGVVSSNSVYLTMAAKLVDRLCDPLEKLPNKLLSAIVEPEPKEEMGREQSSSSDAVSQNVLGSDKTAKSHDANNIIEIPLPVLSRSSLRSLSEVLLLDTCTKSIFSKITSSIGKLARIPSNCSYLTEVLVEVLGDLVLQSQGKLNSVCEILRSNHNINLGETFQSGDRSLALKQLQPILAVINSASGTKQHERMLRTLQTLKNLAEKTNRKLSMVIELTLEGQSQNEFFNAEWMALDNLLLFFRRYVVDDDNSETTENGSSRRHHNRERRSQQSVSTKSASNATLSSLLLRFLHVIETFFMVHAAEILNDKDKSALVSEVKVDSNKESSTTDNEVAKAIAAASISMALGSKYKNTDAYKKNNINLFEGVVDDDKALLARQHSRNLSLRQLSMSSLGIPSMLIRADSTGSCSSFQGFNMSNLFLSNQQRLLRFCQHHSGVLNLLIKAKPQLLNESLASLVRVTQLRPYLSFENKKTYFYENLKKYRFQSNNRGGYRQGRGIHLQVRRDSVFEDSFEQFRNYSGENLRGRLQVNFVDEEGVDAGGLTREWFQILPREMFNPNYALFTTAGDGATFQPNPSSNINMNHLDYFKFVGKVIGKALSEQQLMDAHFTRSFYKHLLGIPVVYTDLEAFEPDYYKSLKSILDFSIEDLGVELTFSAEVQSFGRTQTIDLIPNGRKIAVTDSNKFDYVELISKHRMTTGIKSQIETFMDGFYECVPPELVCIFSPSELELLICGLPDVDVEELRINTEYQQFSAGEEYIQWFWNILRSFTREEKASFLQFVTGTSKVPLDGFAALQGMRGTQKFSIHKAYGDDGKLPTAHTCFNQLDLPVYRSQDELREKLILAIREGSEGFGFA